MDFEFNEEQKSIRALIKEFCEREVDVKRLQEIADKAAVAKNVEEIRDNMPWDLVEKLHDVGLRQLAVPEKYGGGGVSFMTRAAAAEAAGYYGGPLDRLLTLNWKLTADLENLCNEEQQERLYSHFMTNHKAFFAGAMSEPQGATDMTLPYDHPSIMKTVARKDGDEWVINGDKMFCSAGGVATFLIVSTRTAEGPLTKSTTHFIVSTDTPGIEFTVNRIIGGDVMGNVQTHLTDVRVPDSNMLGEVNKAFEHTAGIPGGKSIHFYGLLGVSQRLFDSMLAYAKERIGGGKPIIELPNIAAMVSEAAVNLEATRALLYRGAWEYQKWLDSDRSKSIKPLWGFYINYFWKQMALRLCEIAGEIYAGVGASKDMPLESFVRYLHGMHHGGGTSNLQLIRAARLL